MKGKQSHRTKIEHGDHTENVNKYKLSILKISQFG